VVITAADLIEILNHLEAAGVTVWLDGGWGVDALVGEQTRSHDDLDVVVALTASDAAQAALARLGFAVSDDERPTRFVVRDTQDRRIDFHTVTFDDEGGGIQLLQDGTPWRYPPEGFSGVGHVAGRTVPCLTVETQILTHLGYEPDATDWHDLALLRDRFGVALPAPYDGDATADGSLLMAPCG
jgi:lincosamide nucleotidyltransferase A/C/D/E